MKKKLIAVPVLILVLIVAALLVHALFFGDEGGDGERDLDLFYVSADGLTFSKVPYTFSGGEDVKAKADKVLEQLKTAPEEENCQSPIPQDVLWTATSLEGDNFIIDFAPSYSAMSSTKEIFLRASIVKSLVQISGIDTVEFKINGTPLMSSGDQPVGMMNADLFIDDVDQMWGVNQEQRVTLFYSNKTGDRLVEKNVMITVESNSASMEQLIIESLMKNEYEEEGCYSPIPEGTKVIKTLTKDEVCYVDLSKEFLNPMENVVTEVSVYAIVNSLIERDNINKVQFTIDGQPVDTLREITGFSAYFDRNLDLIQTK